MASERMIILRIYSCSWNCQLADRRIPLLFLLLSVLKITALRVLRFLLFRNFSLQFMNSYPFYTLLVINKLGW